MLVELTTYTQDSSWRSLRNTLRLYVNKIIKTFKRHKYCMYCTIVGVVQKTAVL